MADVTHSHDNTLHWLLGGALVLIGLFAIIMLVLVKSQADSVTTTTAINNASPTVVSEFISTAANGGSDDFSSGIALTAGTTKTIHINGVVQDTNGRADISTVALALYRSGATGGAGCTADNNDCYPVSSCTLATNSDTTQKTYDCSVALKYFTDATDTGSTFAVQNWTAGITVTDASSATGTSSSSVEVNTLLALTIPSSLSFGSLALGTTTTSSNNVTYTLTQQGNQAADVEASMPNAGLTCSSIGNIDNSRVKWALTSVGYADAGATALTSSAVNTVANITRQSDDSTATSSNLFWNISVPSTGVAGTCSGTMTITAVAH